MTASAMARAALLALCALAIPATSRAQAPRGEEESAGDESSAHETSGEAASEAGDARVARAAPARRTRTASARRRAHDEAAARARAPGGEPAPEAEPRASDAAAEAPADEPAISPLRPDPMVPLLWAPARGDECYSRGEGSDGVPAADRICDGPRRVPVPEGEALERAERLGLGSRAAADRLLIGEAPREWLAELPSAPRDDLLWPVARGLFSRGFGFVRREEIRHRPHNGVDIVAEAGAHIRAVNDGLVVYADNGVSGYGNFLVILHGDGSASFYGHCRAIYAAPGQLVARGQVVAEVGATGRPYVPHLHFELRRGGDPVDPMRLFVERPGWREIRPNGGTGFEPPPPNAVAPAP